MKSCLCWLNIFGSQCICNAIGIGSTNQPELWLIPS